MAHPYGSHKSLHTERLGKIMGGSEREKGPKAKHEHLAAAKRGGAMKGEMSMHGSKAKHADRYKKGGRVKGKTHININVMPQSAGAPAGGPPTMPAGLGAAMPPPVMPKPPMAPPPGAAPGGAPGMPPGGPAMPPMMHKRGGAAYKKGGAVSDEKQDKRDMAVAVHKHEKHMHKGEKETKLKHGGRAGPAWMEGLRNGTKTQHAKQGRGVTQDSGDTNRKPVITKKDGGSVRNFSEHVKMKDIKNAAGGGLGRLEKIALYGKKARAK